MLYSIKVFKILITIAFLLLLFNLGLKYFIPDYKTHTDSDISIDEVRRIFLASLNNFDITDGMIKEDLTEELIKYKIDIYSDVPIELILLELERNLYGNDIKILCKDSILNKISVSKIYLNNEQIINATFIKNNEGLTRNKGNISILIKLNSSDDVNQLLLDSTEPISFLIIPDKSFHKIIREFKNHNKQYFIFLNDEINELVYKFGVNYTKLQIKNSINNIIRDFEHSMKIFIDIKGMLKNLDIFNVITYELKRNKISLVNVETFKDLSNEDDYKNEFLKEVYALRNNDLRNFIITPKQYPIISELLPQIRKSGYKVIPITRII
jgi:hypothetical protein